MTPQASFKDSEQEPKEDPLDEARALLGDCHKNVMDLWRIAGELRKIVKNS